MMLCCGEALIDMLPRKTTSGENGFAPYAGGAVFNTAIALGRLGQAAGFFTGLSEDMLAMFCATRFVAAMLNFGYCATVSRPTNNRLRPTRQRPSFVRIL